MITLDKIVALAKRRGFIYPSSEIYGGIAGFWDYGPYGVELKNNIKKAWWKSMVYDREDVVGIDAAVIMNPKVWEASGHVKAFGDPLVECKVCHKRFRKDHYEKALDEFHNRTRQAGTRVTNISPDLMVFICSNGQIHDSKKLTKEKIFNLLTEVYLGATEPKQKAYLRGEITQGVFVNFRNIIDSARVKIPFGIAQIGKAFRNEITPGNFTYRSREFEQMELEFFIKPNEKEAEKWFLYWKKQRLDWYKNLGIDEKNLRFREHSPDERAHYARAAFDIEYNAPFGWSEFEGIHHRGDWDLGRHKLSYRDPISGDVYTPWVIETSGGVDRSMLFFLIDAYREETVNDKPRIYLKLNPKIAPVKVAVFPLQKDGKLNIIAKKIFTDLKKLMVCEFDDAGNIGKMYRRQDEIGTPYCITVDYQSLEDKTITVRVRDTMKQERIAIDKLKDYLLKKLKV